MIIKDAYALAIYDIENKLQTHMHTHTYRHTHIHIHTHIHTHITKFIVFFLPDISYDYFYTTVKLFATSIY